GRIRSDDPSVIAMAIWGQVHGLVSLELARMHEPETDWAGIYEASLEAVARAWTPSAKKEVAVDAVLNVQNGIYCYSLGAPGGNPYAYTFSRNAPHAFAVSSESPEPPNSCTVMPTGAPKAFLPKKRYRVPAVRRPRKFSLEKSTSPLSLPTPSTSTSNGVPAATPSTPKAFFSCTKPSAVCGEG